MKFLLVTFLSCLLFVIGCFRQYPGPIGSLTQDGYFGYWKFVAYHEGKRNVSINQIPGRTLLETKGEIVLADSIFKSFLYRKGGSYWMFSFFDIALNKSLSIPAVFYGNDHRKKEKREYRWYRVNDTSGFLVILNVGHWPSTGMEISNVMKSTVYNPKLDSARYVYKPTEKFN